MLIRLSQLKETLLEERGNSVSWVATIIIGIILAVITFNGLAPGIRNAVQNMSNALGG
ncbi:MAG: hypothetical protein ACM3UW_08355 [Bacillota bacterium]